MQRPSTSYVSYTKVITPPRITFCFCGRATTVAEQTRDALHRNKLAFHPVGATLRGVVRTRSYVTDISRWREVGAVHREVFGEIRPAATMVEVSALIAPALLVEIEVDAYVESPPAGGGGNVPSGPGR